MWVGKAVRANVNGRSLTVRHPIDRVGLVIAGAGGLRLAGIGVRRSK